MYLASIVLFAIHSPVAWAGPLTGEISVLSVAEDGGFSNDVAIKSDRFFVVGEASDVGGDDVGVFARVFDLGGVPPAPEARVNEITAGSQDVVALASTESGAIVLWCSEGEDADGWAVVGRFLDLDGNAISGNFPVNEAAAGDQCSPGIAVLDDGRFLAVWETANLDERRVSARLFDADGDPVTGDIAVRATPANEGEARPDVATNGADTFVVVWMNTGDTPDLPRMTGRLFDTGGAFTGPEFDIDQTIAPTFHTMPRVAMAQNGDFIVAWATAQDDSAPRGIWAQRFDALGEPLGMSEVVSDNADVDQIYPDVAMNGGGLTMFAWSADAGTGDDEQERRQDILATWWDENGLRVGDVFTVNEQVDWSQQLPRVDVSDDSVGAVVWSTYNESSGAISPSARLFISDQTDDDTDDDLDDDDDSDDDSDDDADDDTDDDIATNDDEDDDDGCGC
ncbi:MAG: hypothetical protein KJ042_00275 [Deltaproteobacteria bacterium]|nr:hypothetical protein [Deltaproteobacteria bacterium]